MWLGTVRVSPLAGRLDELAEEEGLFPDKLTVASPLSPSAAAAAAALCALGCMDRMFVDASGGQTQVTDFPF